MQYPNTKKRGSTEAVEPGRSMADTRGEEGHPTSETTTTKHQQKRRRQTPTSTLAILVQQIRLIIQLLIDLRHDSGNGCVDIRRGFHGFDGADGVYRNTQVQRMVSTGIDGRE